MTDRMGLEQVFGGVLDSLSAGARRRLLESAETVEVAPGGRVLTEGGHADGLYVVLSGTVQLSVDQRGADLSVASVGPGELLGWSWLVPPHRWDFDASSAGGATLVRVPAEVLYAVMRDDPADAAALNAEMLAILSRRLRDTRIQLLDLFARSGSGAQS